MPTHGCKHPLADSPLSEPLSEEEKFSAIKNEDWDSLTLSHIRLGCSIAGKYIAKGADPDEMASAAMLGICTAVNKIKQGKLGHDNITGDIANCIHRTCAKAKRKDTNIPQPRDNPIKKTVNFLPEIAIDVFNGVDLNDTLDTLVETDNESLILELRRRGFTDQAIADKLNVSRSYVTKIRIKLLERYDYATST
jgi:DNA-directed RNA polymerase sigma subunit (sigma70/sigma32)